jgi:hypothetical protein
MGDVALDDLGITLDDIDQWIREYQEKQERLKLRRANPYAGDLIRILWPYRNGLHRRYVIDRMWRLREPKGLNMPTAFESAVQSSFQAHAGESDQFKGQPEDDFFYFPLGKRQGKWGVRHEKAATWLKGKRLGEV